MNTEIETQNISSDFKKTRLGFIAQVIDPQPDHRAPAIVETNGFPYIGIRDIMDDGSLNHETARQVSEDAVIKQEQSFKIEDKDIVFCKVGTLGLPRFIKINQRVALSATLVIIKAKHALPGFVRYFLESDFTNNQVDLLATGSTRRALGIEQIRKFHILLPPENTQQTIVHYLDNYLKNLDTLISKKESLISLLEEKRKATINQAVTRGLNPEVKMKDSGVEWLGQMPEHWEIAPLKYLTNQILDCRHRTPEYTTDSGYYVIRTTNIKNGKLIRESLLETTEQEYVDSLKYTPVEIGDVVFTREAPAGEAITILDDLNYTLGQRVMLIKCNKAKLINSFLVYFIYTQQFKGFVDLQSNGSTVSHINVGQVVNIPIVLPSLQEQISIVYHLDQETSKIDLLIDKLKQSIEKLKEYRSAVITAAVTGQMEVPEHLPE